MISIQKGVGRTVILIGPWAIKFPSMRNGGLYFVYGMLANRLEWDLWRKHKHPKMGKMLWCAPLGFIGTMKRYKTLLDRPLTQDEVMLFPFVCLDNNGNNVAKTESGDLVLIDYGNPTIYYIKDEA